MDDRIANLDYAAEADDRPLLHLVSIQPFRVIAKVAQKPAQFPQSFFRAIQSARNDLAGGCARFENRQPEKVKRLARVPAVLELVDPHQVNPIREFACW